MKRIFALCMIAVLALNLCGCDLWMEGSYHSISRHQEDYNTLTVESTEVSNYSQLKTALMDMIGKGMEEGVIYARQLDQQELKTYMNMAIPMIINRTAIGAFAVDSIRYDVGTNAGRTAIAFQVNYIRSRAEILRIKRVGNMEKACASIEEAMKNCEPSVVVLVDRYQQTDFVQMIQDYVEANPDICMEMPQVHAAVYPQTGDERVVELIFTYQTSRETLRTMQSYVGPVFRAANLNVSGEESESAKFQRMYAFLMERSDYQVETSTTPSYSLLRHGVGDSKAFATVYAAMCRGADLDCQVVSGTRNGETWFWNIICQDGEYYFVDLLRSLSAGSLLLMTEDAMSDYVWDYTAYPQTGPTLEKPENGETLPTEPGTTEPEPTEPSEPTQPEVEETLPPEVQPTDPTPAEPTDPQPSEPDKVE